MAVQAGYVPGLCNIGGAEKQRRVRSGHAGVIFGVALLVVLVVAGSSPWGYLALFFPAFIAAIGYIQAAHSFCVGFARRGIQNFGEIGEAVPITEAQFLARDRATALRLNLFALVIAVGVALVGFGLAMALA